METLSLDLIRCDGGTQSRLFNDATTIDEYKEAMTRGEQFAAVVVFFDGTNYWLADGFHRVIAARSAQLPSLAADVRQGTQRDAILYSVGANSQHGLKRTNADKRRAVKMLLDDAEWGQNSSSWIAEKCGVQHPFVLEEKSKHPKFEVVSDTTSKVRGKDGKMYPAKKAPRAKAPPPPQSPNGATGNSLPNRSDGELKIPPPPEEEKRQATHSSSDTPPPPKSESSDKPPSNWPSLPNNSSKAEAEEVPIAALPDFQALIKWALTNSDDFPSEWIERARELLQKETK